MKPIRSLLAAFLFGALIQAQPLTIYTETFPPYQFFGQDGHITGFAVDLVREIQARTGEREPIEVVPWVRGYHEALAKPNVVLFTMARSPERESLFKWVGPISESFNVLYVRADSKISLKSLEDAKRLPLIGVYKEDIRDQFLTQAGFTNLDRSPDQVIMLRKLMAGRINAIASTPEAIFDLARVEGFKAQDLRPALLLMKVQAYIAFSKNTPAPTVQAWSKALDAMKADGTFQSIHRRYFPSDDNS